MVVQQVAKQPEQNLIAKKYNFKFLSSGLLYRYAGFLIIKKKYQKIKHIFKKEFKRINLKNRKIAVKHSKNFRIFIRNCKKKKK